MAKIVGSAESVDQRAYMRLHPGSLTVVSPLIVAVKAPGEGVQEVHVEMATFLST